MIDKLNPHYSFENIPSVYDEESLTALEMCGRMGKKLNEVITAVNGWEVPKIVYVSPTGDPTGELDRAVIQGKLDAGYAVHLSAGEYYLNNPLIFRAGYMLRGDSQLNTVINCKTGFIDHDNITSVDHVEVRDVRVKGSGTGIGINISRKLEGLETGGRYAHFMNVYISGYEISVRLCGCWCTNFTHCRIEASNICVEQRGSCNHIKYDHCMMLGDNSGKTIGLKIATENGAENYGISVDHCDFERLNHAINAYCCVALNVSHIYVESTSIVFQLDNCPGFLCDGGYIAYPGRVCNTNHSSTAKVFSKCNGAIKNLYVRVNKDDSFFLLSTATDAPINMEGVTCVNDGQGECFVDAQHLSSLSNGLTHYNHIRFLNDEINLTASVSLSNNGKEFRPYKTSDEYKIYNVRIRMLETITPTQNTTIRLLLKDKGIFECYLNQGQTYNNGSWLTLNNVSASFRDLIFTNSDIGTLIIGPTISGFASSMKCRILIDFAVGEFIL